VLYSLILVLGTSTISLESVIGIKFNCLISVPLSSSIIDDAFLFEFVSESDEAVKVASLFYSHDSLIKIFGLKEKYNK
jgi:hypothetical protein